MKKKISSIVFDLGNVLVPFSLTPFLNFLSERGFEVDNSVSLYHEIGGYDFECGTISGNDFLDRILNLSKITASRDELKSAWEEIFEPNPEALELLSSLRANLRTYILSNSNELHWGYLKRKYEIETWVDDLLSSHQAGVMKPAPAIYSAAERKFNLSPAETLFIDDRIENIEGAIRAGWNALHFSDVHSLEKQLTEMGCLK